MKIYRINPEMLNNSYSKHRNDTKLTLLLLYLFCASKIIFLKSLRRFITFSVINGIKTILTETDNRVSYTIK